jgi:hypothetical protein
VPPATFAARSAEESSHGCTNCSDALRSFAGVVITAFFEPLKPWLVAQASRLRCQVGDLPHLRLLLTPVPLVTIPAIPPLAVLLSPLVDPMEHKALIRVAVAVVNLDA